MAKHPVEIEVWTKNASELQKLRKAVRTFNGAISAEMACIEQEEERAGDVWVTLSAANAQQVFALGRCYGTLLGKEGEVGNG